MKQNSCYVLKRIANVPYLLPVGQLIADQRSGVQINETGVYLWNLLEKERSIEELSALCATHYGADTEDIPGLENDVREFVTQLLAQGIIVSSEESITENKLANQLTNQYTDKSLKQSGENICRYITIAGLTCMYDGPSQAFPTEFNAFLSEPSEPHQNILILEHLPAIHENGKLILRNSELFVIECDEKYILLFPSFAQIAETHISKDASLCIFYCKSPYNHDFRNELFQAMQFPFFYLFQKHHMAVLHSSSILYEGRAWLFSASSGTGKSTHANLWRNSLQTPILNGDLNLLSVENGKAVIHGIPWCGSSAIFDTHTHPLGGIILLRQSPSDFVEQLTEDKKRLLVLQRIVSPAWNDDLYDISLHLVNALAEQILICRLHCTPRPESVDVIRNEINSLYPLTLGNKS